MAIDVCDRLSRLLGCGWDVVRVEMEDGGDAQEELALARWRAQLTMVLVEALTTTQSAEVLITSSRALPWGSEGTCARALVACFISCLLGAQTLRPLATDIVLRVLISQMGIASRPPPPRPLPSLSCRDDALVDAVLKSLSACPTLPSDAIQNAVEACLQGMMVEEGQAHGQGVFAKGRGDVVVMIERLLALGAAEPSRAAAAVVSAVLVVLDAVEREERERTTGVKRDRDAAPTACRTHTSRRMRIVDRSLVRLLCWVTDVHLRGDGRTHRAVALGVLQALQSLQSDPTWHPTWCIWSSLLVLHVLNRAPSSLTPPPPDHTPAPSLPPLPINWGAHFTKHVAPTHGVDADTATHTHTHTRAHSLGERRRVCINRRGQVWVDVAVTVPPQAPLPSSASFVCSLVGGAETLDPTSYDVAHAVPRHTPRMLRIIRRGGNKHDPVQVLPCELWRHCLSYLSPMRIAWACAPVSMAWKSAADDPALWKGFYHRRWNKVVCAAAFVTSRDGDGGHGREDGKVALSEQLLGASAVVVREEGSSTEVVGIDGGGLRQGGEVGGARCGVCGGGLELLPGQAAVPPVASRSHSMMATLSSSSPPPAPPLLASSSPLPSSCSSTSLSPSIPTSSTTAAATSIRGRAVGLAPAEHARTACLLLSTRLDGGGGGGGLSWRKLYGERARAVALNRRENNVMRKGSPYSVCSVVGCTERLRACTSITAHMRSHHKAARKAGDASAYEGCRRKQTCSHSIEAHPQYSQPCVLKS